MTYNLISGLGYFRGLRFFTLGEYYGNQTGQVFLQEFQRTESYKSNFRKRMDVRVRSRRKKGKFRKKRAKILFLPTFCSYYCTARAEMRDFFIS